jgi:hypothetical protein
MIRTVFLIKNLAICSGAFFLFGYHTPTDDQIKNEIINKSKTEYSNNMETVHVQMMKQEMVLLVAKEVRILSQMVKNLNVTLKMFLHKKCKHIAKNYRNNKIASIFLTRKRKMLFFA